MREQVAQDALLQAVEDVVWPESDEEGVLWATLRTVTDRAIADYLAGRKRRRKHEGAMPDDPTVQDEAGDQVPDEEADADPAHDPRVPDAKVEGLVLRRYLESAVRGNARDEETYGWLVAWSDEEQTFDDIARRSNLSVNTVYSRVHDFKATYLPRFRRWRNGMLLVLLLVALVAIALAAAWLAPRGMRSDDIQPDPDTARPPPSASGSGTPVLVQPPDPEPPERFNQAAPTDAGPFEPLKPRLRP